MTAPHITDAEIAAMRETILARGKIRTHSSNCWLWENHRDCAILRLLAEIERLRAELEQQRTRAEAAEEEIERAYHDAKERAERRKETP